MLKIVILVYLAIYDAHANQATVTIRDIQKIKRVLKRTSEFETNCAASTDCAVLPVGARACGGPSDYLIYSKLSSYNEEIQKLAAVSTKLETEYNKEHSAKTTCTIAPQPSSLCVDNRCKRTTILVSIVYPFGRS